MKKLFIAGAALLFCVFSYGAKAASIGDDSKTSLNDKKVKVFKITKVNDDSTQTQMSNSISQVFPNPAIDKVNIKVMLKDPAAITLTIYDMKGNRVKQPFQDIVLQRGESQLDPISISDLAVGKYEIQLKVGSDIETAQLVVVK